MMRLDWSTVNSIMKAAVKRGMKRREAVPVAYLGMDEKSFRRGHVHASILNDLDDNRVWDLAEGRKTENASGLLDTLSEGQRSGVQAVTMDMWPAFEAAVREKLPQADIVYNKLHISGYLNKAVDDVRKEEHRELMAKGKDTLKGTKYQWLRNFPDLRSEPAFRELYSATMKTSRA